MAYTVVLLCHSWLRWLVLISGLAVVGRAAHGVATRHAWTPRDRTFGVTFLSILDAQFALGLLLYFVLSPITPKSLSDFRAYMPVAPLRFFAIEHATGMLIAVAVAHAGWRRLKSSRDDRGRHMCALVAFCIALAAIAISIPWPWMSYGRPLARTP